MTSTAFWELKRLLYVLAWIFRLRWRWIVVAYCAWFHRNVTLIGCLEKWPIMWRSFPLRRLLMSVAGQKSIVERLWRKFFSDPSQWWDHRLDKVNRSNCCHTILLLMQKFSGFRLVLTVCIKHVKICGWSAGVGFLDIGKFKVSWFQTQEDTAGTLAQRQIQTPMGRNRAGSNCTRGYTIRSFSMECKACKICYGWPTWEDNGTFPANATRGHDSRQVHFC